MIPQYIVCLYHPSSYASNEIVHGCDNERVLLELKEQEDNNQCFDIDYNEIIDESDHHSHSEIGVSESLVKSSDEYT